MVRSVKDSPGAPLKWMTQKRPAVEGRSWALTTQMMLLCLMVMSVTRMSSGPWWWKRHAQVTDAASECYCSNTSTTSQQITTRADITTKEQHGRGLSHSSMGCAVSH